MIDPITGYVTPARCSSIASWLTQKRLSHWLRHTCKVFLVRIAADSRRSVVHIGYVTPARCSSISSWLLQKRLSHWLRHTCNGFPCSHRGLRRTVFHIGYVTPARSSSIASGLYAEMSSIASWLTQKRLAAWSHLQGFP